jgi:hypothetical protein
MAEAIYYRNLSLAGLDYGYKSNPFALAESGEFAVLILPLLSFTKKLADTTYCGPPFIIFLRYLGIS